MKRIPIITSVESKLCFPVSEVSETAPGKTFSYNESINVESKQVNSNESFEQVTSNSFAVGLSGYVHIGFSSQENGKMYDLKVRVKTAFLATYVQCPGGCLQMAMAASLS